MAAAVAAAAASAPNTLTKLVQSSERIPLSAALEVRAVRHWDELCRVLYV